MPASGELPSRNASPDEIRAILRDCHTIAVVGLSDIPERASHYVAAYLQGHGYRILSVNPRVASVLGEKSYANLRDIPEKIDLVDIFRTTEAVPEIVDDAIGIAAKVIWMQEGIVHNAAAQKARAAGLKVVMDRCTLKEHARLINA